MELAQFLVKAKLAGYASQEAVNEKILDDGSHELTVNGEEVVFHGGKVTWAMNYYVEILNDAVPAKQIYGFLQQAMRQVGEDRPFRGPNRFQQGDLEYKEDPLSGDAQEWVSSLPV
mgnify:CR=1 FL=1